MSEKNVMRKLKGEATQRARDKGHEVTRFRKIVDRYAAECWKCNEGVVIRPAVDSGVHVVDGKVLKERCRNEFTMPLTPGVSFIGCGGRRDETRG